MAEAELKFKQAVELDPRNANAWNGLGWSQFNAGKDEIAIRAFQKAVQIAPDHPAALNGLGQIYISQRRYTDAEKVLLKAAPRRRRHGLDWPGSICCKANMKKQSLGQKN